MGARGTLKVYVGMAAGVGKTYAMLEEGQDRSRDGEDVVIGWLETRPISKRVDVPLFPMSSASRGWSRPPTPTPSITHSPSPVRSMLAPIARMAAAVARTSCPSSSPVTRLVPTASADNIKARCEMLLSPGIAILPLSGADAATLRGRAVWSVMACGF